MDLKILFLCLAPFSDSLPLSIQIPDSIPPWGVMSLTLSFLRLETRDSLLCGFRGLWVSSVPSGPTQGLAHSKPWMNVWWKNSYANGRINWIYLKRIKKRIQRLILMLDFEEMTTVQCLLCINDRKALETSLNSHTPQITPQTQHLPCESGLASTSTHCC